MSLPAPESVHPQPAADGEKPPGTVPPMPRMQGHKPATG